MKTLFYSLFFCFYVIFINSCDEEENTDGNVIHITEDITQITTWETGYIYIIDASDLWVTNTLTIQQGVIVKFTENGAYMSVGAGGSIHANGTTPQPVIFTSEHDDLNGGDNNSDGTLTGPEPGNWAKILIEDDGSIFNHCIFQYGGGFDARSTLDLYGVRAVVTNCIFTCNMGGFFGHYRGALDASNAEPETVIRNNWFYSNQIPLSIASEISTDNSNLFHNLDDPTEINTMNGIFVYDFDDIESNVSWQETEVPYVIDDGDLWIDASGVLNLADNIVLKFTKNSWLNIAETGEFNFNSTNIFTSFLDDSYLGDTNGDGTSTVPWDNYWGGIYFDGPGTYLYGENVLYNSY